MNLLDKYITAVGDNLPRKGRADIEAEIRSTLQDMLDDRSRETGQAIDEAMISTVLKEYGAPAKVAATYQTPRSLIGPHLYPTFELVLKIVLAVIVGVSLFNLAIGTLSNPGGLQFGAALWQFVGQAMGGLVAAFGNVVLVFAILERVLKAEDFEKGAQAWDPADLAKTPDPEQVKRLDLIVEMVFTVIGLLLINFYSYLIGIGFVEDGKWTFVPILSHGFFQYLPFINGLAVLHIALNLWVLRQNKWQTWTRLAGLAVTALGIALAVVMVSGPSLIAISAETVAGTPLAGHEGLLLASVTLGITIGLVVSIIVNAIELVRALYKLVMHRPMPAFPVVK